MLQRLYLKLYEIFETNVLLNNLKSTYYSQFIRIVYKNKCKKTQYQLILIFLEVVYLF